MKLWFLKFRKAISRGFQFWMGSKTQRSYVSRKVINNHTFLEVVHSIWNISLGTNLQIICSNYPELFQFGVMSDNSVLMVLNKGYVLFSLFSYLQQKPRNVKLITEIVLSLRNGELFVTSLSRNYEVERIVYHKEWFRISFSTLLINSKIILRGKSISKGHLFYDIAFPCRNSPQLQVELLYAV